MCGYIVFSPSILQSVINAAYTPSGLSFSSFPPSLLLFLLLLVENTRDRDFFRNFFRIRTYVYIYIYRKTRAENFVKQESSVEISNSVRVILSIERIARFLDSGRDPRLWRRDDCAIGRNETFPLDPQR